MFVPLVILLFKMVPSAELTCCLVSVNAGGCDVPSRTHVVGKLRSGLSYISAGREVRVNS